MKIFENLISAIATTEIILNSSRRRVHRVVWHWLGQSTRNLIDAENTQPRQWMCAEVLEPFSVYGQAKICCRD